MTLRALDVLRTADVIAAEDTRVSSVLLRHYGVSAKLVSLHAHNERQRAAWVVEQLRDGRSVALISDAGTPGVSDPGARVTRAVWDAGFSVVPLPGPNAAITAISAAGLAAERFVFVGFLPGTPKARRALLQALATLPCALVFYEAPHRVHDTLRELATTLQPERPLTIARELTKRFESIATMRLDAAEAWLAADPNRSRGEFVLIVDASETSAAPAMLDAAGERWLQALLDHLPPAQAARIAAAATGVARDAIYARVTSMRAAKSS